MQHRPVSAEGDDEIRVVEELDGAVRDLIEDGEVRELALLARRVRLNDKTQVRVMRRQEAENLGHRGLHTAVVLLLYEEHALRRPRPLAQVVGGREGRRRAPWRAVDGQQARLPCLVSAALVMYRLIPGLWSCYLLGELGVGHGRQVAEHMYAARPACL